ncbi:hypothetical protein KUTeg_023396 [Tegillarca granosa]|uniref:Uncharacterized protein n=1 Tax=Tegillarca granosa TaxID=220873 RepID=A0ABQ9E6F9_TEGGR|nr:hypothetical protein KUTeg_023396 [Tegillarca granosa]
MATGTSKKGLNYIKEDNETEDSPPSYTQSVYDTGIQLDTIKPNFQNDVYNAGYDQGTQVTISEAPKPLPKKVKKPKKTIVPEKPQSWIGAAICSCVFCFFPTGICAVITALNAQEAYRDGDYEEAERGTNTAKHLTIASMVIGFLLIVVLAMSLHFHFNS